MWTWDQSSGIMFDPEGNEFAKGYAGYGEGKNNPEMENVVAIGPIPKGTWIMTDIRNSSNTGPATIVLEPHDKNQTFGRSEFRIHGDSIKNPGKASHGCICFGPATLRKKMYTKGDLIKVIA